MKLSFQYNSFISVITVFKEMNNTLNLVLLSIEQPSTTTSTPAQAGPIKVFSDVSKVQVL